MGKTYTVPRNVKGETRILYIFSIRSFVTTVLGAAVGFIFYFILSLLGFGMAAWIVLGIFAVIGFGIGSLTIPDTPIVGNLRKAGGERVGDILLRTITFRKRKKLYIYREDGN